MIFEPAGTPWATVIIVSWNTCQLLRECLNSLRAHLGNLELEIIVVDNASIDGSADMVEREFPECHIVRNSENVGFGRANNQAAALAHGKYLVLLNSDTRVTDDGLDELLQYMERNPSVGITTGKTLYADMSFQPPYRRFPGLVGSILDQSVFRLVPAPALYRNWRQYRGHTPSAERDVDWVVGAFLVMRAELATGGKIFDEEIFMYYEDTLLCRRVWDQGYRVVYLPVAPVIHYRGKSAGQVRPFAVWNSFLGGKTYLYRRYGRPGEWVYVNMVRLFWYGFATVLSVAAITGSARLHKKRDLFRALIRGNVQV